MCNNSVGLIAVVSTDQQRVSLKFSDFNFKQIRIRVSGTIK